MTLEEKLLSHIESDDNYVIDLDQHDSVNMNEDDIKITVAESSEYFATHFVAACSQAQFLERLKFICSFFWIFHRFNAHRLENGAG